MNEENSDVRRKILDDRDERHSKVIKGMIEELTKKEKCPYSLTMPYSNAKYKRVEHAIIVTHKCRREKGHEGKCICCGITWIGWTK